MSPHLFTRRKVLKLSAALALGTLPGVARARGSDSREDFSFVVANDLHFRDDRCAEWLAALAHAMKSHRPDFCVLNGDLTENGTCEQLLAVREIFAAAGLPLYVTIGNHDHIADDDCSAYASVFPQSLNYAFAHRGWRFLAIDSTEGLRVFHTRIHEPALTWMDETLPALDKKTPLVLFTHFPLGSRVLCRPLNAPAVLGKLRDYNLRAVFNGHWHGYARRELRGATIINNRCCSWWRPNNDRSPDKGYFLCRAARDGSITREFYTLQHGTPAAA